MTIRKHNILLIMLILIVTAMTSCDNRTIYYQYEHTAMTGWEKNDTLTYDVPSVIRPGVYASMVGIRVNGRYPFKYLALVVEQTIYTNGGKKQQKKVFKSTDQEMVNCRINNDDGSPAGNGTSYIQFEVPLTMKAHLAPGDSLHFTVRHNMKRNILPGIADVGVKLARL